MSTGPNIEYTIRYKLNVDGLKTEMSSAIGDVLDSMKTGDSSVKSTSLSSIDAKINQSIYQFINKKIKPAMEAAAAAASEELLAKSIPVTPKEFGPLRESGKVVKPEWLSSRIVETKVTFGDDSVGYAYFVHYDLPSEYRPKKYTLDNTGPYYLVNPAISLLTQSYLKNIFESNV
jgi:hypothetical protein